MTQPDSIEWKAHETGNGWGVSSRANGGEWSLMVTGLAKFDALQVARNCQRTDDDESTKHNNEMGSWYE